jgi:tricorn protease
MPASGGQAARLTAMDGEETRPAISPDGKWLAFSGTQYGSKDVFLMPLAGGQITQLTYHDSYDDVDSWSWDSRTIYFTSGRMNRFSGYSIGINGGTPKRLFNHYFDDVHNVAMHPTSGEIFFNESWESKNFAHRKRYKGDYNPDIKSYNPKNKKFTTYTDYNGKDFGVTLDRKGNMYFMSDEANGEYNLYTIQNGVKKPLTDFPTSIYWPRVSADGSKIVFRKDYKIFVYDVASANVTSPKISLFRNQTLNKAESFNVSGNITDFNVSPDNKKIAFISRGKLFISDIEGKFVKEIKTHPKEAVQEVHWLKDNATLLFSQTSGGYYNWYSTSAKGPGLIKTHTSDQKNNRMLTFNSDHTKATYLSGRDEVRVMDMETMASETVATDELWGFYNSAPRYSPDDRYIMYSAYRDFEQDVMVYDTETKSKMNLTSTRVSESGPIWSPDGKYIYFSSDLLNPSYPYGPKDAGIYRIMLDKFEDPFRTEKVANLFEEEKKEKEKDKKEDAEKDEEEQGDDEEKDEEKVKVAVNQEGLMDRIERVSPSFGQQGSPYIFQKDDKTMVIYISDHDEGENHLWKTTIEPFEKNKTEKLSKERMSGYGISSAKNKHYILSGGNIHTFDVDGGKMEKINISHSFTKTMKDEFEQIFQEAWAGVEENFYDENFHGQDWNALRDIYASYLPGVTTRAELRMIFNEMLGELNTSHFGFYSNGKEEDTYHGSQTMETGIVFKNNDPFTVERIIKDSPADITGKDIMKGDKLVAVNGVPVDPSMNRNAYFTVPKRDEEITLSLSRAGTNHEVHIHTTSSNSMRDLLYDEWQDANQAYVDSKSNKKIAYIHMKNMGGGELQNFKRDIVTESAYRDGLILDLRYNTGGNVHDDVLRLLSQRTYLKWKYREGALTSQSNFGPSDKPIVLLINEQSLSDAEMTAAGFKALKLGTIVGTETYRWIIFTTGNGLVDGSFYRLPSWGCYTLSGDDLETTGVSPDIRVDESFKDRIEGNQPQLDKAIEIIMQQLK